MNASVDAKTLVHMSRIEHAAMRQVSGEREPAVPTEISLYRDTIPGFVEPELDRLYGSVYSALAHFRIYGQVSGTYTWVARRRGRTEAVLLFRLQCGQVRVVNEVLWLEPEQIRRFASWVFAHFPQAGVILLRAIRTGPESLGWLTQRHHDLEDLVLALPDSATAYTASLGKNTRHNLRRYSARLAQRYPGAQFSVLHTEQIDARLIADIAALSHARMASKDKHSSHTSQSTASLLQHARLCGMIGVVTIDGRVAAGAISFRSGAHYYLNVLAHDPAYDEVWLGMLCCYQTICACIARGGREFHFLWGAYRYKMLFGARPRALDNIALYRSPLQLLVHGRQAARMGWESARRSVHAASRALVHSARQLRLSLRVFLRQPPDPGTPKPAATPSPARPSCESRP